MADATTTTTAEQDKVHQEGIDHINAKLDGTTLSSEPPASNPGADDKTAGIAPGAGGVSGAAYKDISNPATAKSEKRKSIIGTFKGYLGLDKKAQGQQKASAPTSDGTYIGAATAAVTGTVAAVAETVQNYAAGTSTTEPAAATETETENKETSAAATTTDKPAEGASDGPAKAVTTDESTIAAKAVDGADDETTAPETTDDGEHKPPKEAAGDPAKRTNPDAIPVAGGKKVGEDHIGESKPIPDDPGPPAEEKAEEAGVASDAGQPTKEVSDNTAKNTGGATGGPATGSSDAAASGEKSKDKPKLLQKLKEKLKKNKE